ncbi:hypothetical protein [Plesiomonas shigelloides]|uniref:hypothetical protein n=1 Tax=Plesiomonas shigelloides TaxID=703 RepID=UPI0012619717|nr:hypothetical protein [Plesiomonas shigelloides]KAB7691837.1 hypothetical protein GBN28_03440 [Plesiomonas shigelloides]
MKLENVKLKDVTFGHILRLIREVSVVGVLAYFAIAIFSGGFSLDFTKLTASELVSILLAFFSIALSAAFYFAATNSSNQFYDNISKFNKDTSELLGRVDEQIKSVNSRQDELRDSFNKHYGKSSSESLAETTDETNKKLEKAQKDWDTFINRVINNTPTSKRGELEQELKLKEAELSTLREQKAEQQARASDPVRIYTRTRIKRMGIEAAVALSPRELLFKLAADGHTAYRRDLAILGYISTRNLNAPSEVTTQGEKFVTRILEQMIETVE